MPFESVLKDLIGQLIGLGAGSEAQNATSKAFLRIFELLHGTLVVLVQWIIAELWWTAHLGAAVNDVAESNTRIGNDIQTIAQNEGQAWDELLNVKLPADTAALYRALDTHSVKTITKTQAAAKVNLKPLQQAIAELQKWRSDTVTPDLNKWNGFYNRWKNTYLPPVTTLMSWLHSPTTLSQFLLPSAIALLPSALRLPASQISATSIEQALVATWARDPRTIMDLVMAAYVTEF